ncbi:MAG: hypothetical protein AAB375_00465 [Patescibacteria group bacterium]
MKILFTGLFLETAGLVWDFIMHFSGAAEGEGFIEPAHLVIFIGFVVSFAGAVLVYKKYSQRS